MTFCRADNEICVCVCCVACSMFWHDISFVLNSYVHPDFRRGFRSHIVAATQAQMGI